MIKELYLICSMLMDIPIEIYNNKTRKPISKIYASILFNYNQYPMIGDAETLHEKIYIASRYLVKGRWKECYGTISNLIYFSKLEDKVKFNIKERIKCIGLEAYIMYNKEFYQNIYINEISIEFDCTLQDVKDKITKLITNYKLNANINNKNVLLEYMCI